MSSLPAAANPPAEEATGSLAAGDTQRLLHRLEEAGYFEAVQIGQYQTVKADKDIYLGVRRSAYAPGSYSAFYDESSTTRDLTFELIYHRDRVLLAYAKPSGINRDEADRLVRSELSKMMARQRLASEDKG